jgi:GTPase Era involved in 16S rRNA processing
MTLKYFIIGLTGAGKSTLVNVLSKGENCTTSSSLDGCTTICKEIPVGVYSIIDTPGLDDSRVNSVEIIKKYIKTHLAETEAFFIIITHPHGTRFTLTLEESLNKLFPVWKVDVLTKADKASKDQYKEFHDRFPHAKDSFGSSLHTMPNDCTTRWACEQHWKKLEKEQDEKRQAQRIIERDRLKSYYHESWTNYYKTYYSDQNICKALGINTVSLPNYVNNPVTLKTGSWTDAHQYTTKDYDDGLIVGTIYITTRRIANLFETKYSREVKIIGNKYPFKL